MKKSEFIIAWTNPDGLLYLKMDGDGIVAVGERTEATTFPTYEDGWAVFQQWAPAMGDLNGAVLRLDEIDMQFDDQRPCPRPAFNLSDEAFNALRAETVKTITDTQTQRDAAVSHAVSLEGELGLAKAVIKHLRDEFPEDVARIEKLVMSSVN